MLYLYMYKVNMFEFCGRVLCCLTFFITHYIWKVKDLSLKSKIIIVLYYDNTDRSEC